MLHLDSALSMRFSWVPTVNKPIWCVLGGGNKVLFMICWWDRWAREHVKCVKSIKSRTEVRPLLSQRGGEVIFSTALHFFFCHPPSYLPRLRVATKPHICFRYATTAELIQRLFSVLYLWQSVLNSAQWEKAARSQFAFSCPCRTHGIWSAMMDWYYRRLPSLSAFSGSSRTCTDNTPSITNILKPRAGECLKPQPYNVMKNTHSCSNNHIII